jgi:SAM-dependent methyltransferase
MNEIDNHFSQIAGGKILDVATGDGGFIELLTDKLQTYDEIVGIDIVESKFDKAREKYEGKNISFAKMDGTRLAFENENFDTVSICNSLHHLSNINEALDEMKRILRPGGTFIVAEMICDNQSELQLNHVDLHHWWAKINQMEGITHNQTMTKSEIISYVEALNLSSVNIYDYVDPDTDPQDKDTIQYLNNVIDEYLEKLNGKPEHRNLIREGQSIRERINKIGIAWATQLVLIGTK